MKGPETADENVALETKAKEWVVARHLSKAYGPVQAVDDVSFSVHRGEIHGLLGPNGAGKSTTLRMLIGFQYPDSGQVLLDGRDVYREGPEARARLGYMPEALRLYPEMDVRGYLRHFAQIKGVDNPTEAVDRVVGQLSLEDVATRPCGNLSRGYRQRVGLGQALLSDPQVLVLDEPSAGLDPNQIHDFRELIRSLGRDRAILLSTHILPEALAICDRVTILSKGKVVASRRPSDLASTDESVRWVRIRAAASRIEPALRDKYRLVAAGEGRGKGESSSVTDAIMTDAARTDDAAAETIPTDAATTGAATGGAATTDPVTTNAALFYEATLEPELVDEFLSDAVRCGWELLELRTGTAGLEAAFRQLTLGEAG